MANHKWIPLADSLPRPFQSVLIRPGVVSRQSTGYLDEAGTWWDHVSCSKVEPKEWMTLNEDVF